MESSAEKAWRASWLALNARAQWYLERGSELQPSVSRGEAFHGLPRFRIWNSANGFCDAVGPTSFTVYELFAENDRRVPVVREVIWNRSGDLDRAYAETHRTERDIDFGPTMLVRDADVPAEAFAALLAEATAFRIPVAWWNDTESVTCDASKVGFEFFSRDQPPASLRLTFSSDTPPEWEPVLGWWRRMYDFLDDRFPK